MWSLARVVVLLFVLAAPSMTRAQPVNLASPPAGVTRVTAAVVTNKISSISELEGTFAHDFYFYIAWPDARQPEGPFDTTASGCPFWPSPEIMNIANGSPDPPTFSCEFTPDAPAYVAAADRVGKPMWGECTSRFRVTLDATLTLKMYPYDRQTASVVIESTDYESDVIKWVAAAGSTASIIPPSGVSGIAGWVIMGTSVSSTEHDYPLFSETFNQLAINLVLQRNPDYFVTRYVWGVTFLVAMGLLVLLVPGDQPDRLGFVQSSFLGIVSWQFILVVSTPNMGYSTRLDEFFIVAMAIVFAAYVWNSFRIAFFDMLEAPPPTQRDADSDAGATKKEDAAEVGAGQWTRSRAVVAPEEAPPPQKWRLLRAFLNVICCGNTTLHWRADTTVGIVLALAFAIATASLFSQPAMDAYK